MSNIGSNAGSGLRGGVHSVHGAGEAIRGQINSFADSAVGSHDSAAQNQALSDRGVNEFQTGTSTHHNPGSSFDKHPSDVRAPAGEYQPGSSFDKHPSDIKSAGLRGNPGADNWTPSNTTSSTGAYGHPSSTNAGPHSSSLGNKTDPRIDSDLDGRGVTGSHSGSGAVPHTTTSGGYGSSTGGYGSSTEKYGTDSGAVPHTTTSGGYGASTGEYGNPKSSNSGPHGSNVLNKVDPRVDSDRDNRGLTGNQTGAAGGPHDSNVLNKTDPRVDSDFDNRGAHSTGHSTGGHAGTTGPSKAGRTSGDPTGISRPSNAGLPTREDDRGNLRETRRDGNSSTNAGPHDSNVGNKVDPRIDSDRDNRGLTGNTSGAAAGPHHSGAANKADPRVDSDRDNRAAGHHNVGTGVTPGSYGSDELASSTHNTSTTHPSSTTHGHHNAGTGVTPGSYGSDELATDKPGQHRPDSAHDTAHVKDGESTENKGGHPPHKSNILNKLDPRVKTGSS